MHAVEHCQQKNGFFHDKQLIFKGENDMIVIFSLTKTKH